MPLRVHEFARTEQITTARALQLLQKRGEFVRSASSTLTPLAVHGLRVELARVAEGTRIRWAAEREPRRPGSPHTSTPPPIAPAPRRPSSDEQVQPEDRRLLDWLRSGHRAYHPTRLTRAQAERELFAPAPDPVALDRAEHARREREEATAQVVRNKRRHNIWAPYRFSDSDSRAWVTSGLDLDKPDVASAARRVGITPQDLKTRVDGRRVAARLNGGESATSVSVRLRMTRHATS